MSDFDGSGRNFDRSGTEFDEPLKQRPGSAFGDLGDRLARAFGTFERPKAGVATSVPSDEGGAVDREAGPFQEPPAPRFQFAWRGYDRVAVDEYVTDLERYVGELDRELASLQARSPSGSSVVDEIQRIGDQTAAIIRVAHQQAEAVTRRAQAEAEQCVAQANSDASAITEAAKQQLRLLDSETDSVWRERERLVTDLHKLAEGMSSLAHDAAGRFPAEQAEPAVPAEQLAPAAPAAAGEHMNGLGSQGPQEA